MNKAGTLVEILLVGGGGGGGGVLLLSSFLISIFSFLISRSQGAMEEEAAGAVY